MYTSIYREVYVYIHTHTQIYILMAYQVSLFQWKAEKGEKKKKEGRVRVHFVKEGDIIVMLEARVLHLHSH